MKYRNCRWSVLLAASIVVSACSFASTAGAAEPVSPEVEAKIRELIVLTGGPNLAKQMMGQMLEPMMKALPSVPEEFWSRFMSRIDPEDFVRMMVPIYARYYSSDEIAGLVAFYQTSLGRKVIATMPQVMHDSVAAGQEWGQKLGSKVAEELRAEGYKVP